MKKFSKIIAGSVMVMAVYGALLMPALASITSDTGLVHTASKSGFKTENSDLAPLIGGLIQNLMGLLGSIFLLLLIYAGALWMTAQGDTDKIKKAKGIIMNAVLGIVLVFASYTLVGYVVGKLSTSPSSSPAIDAPNTTTISDPNSPPAEVVPGLDGTDVYDSSDPNDPLGNLGP